MFEVGKFLDRAKAQARISSDYALAKQLGISHSRISNWRRGENVPDERAVVKLCELAREDADFTLASIQALRAANDDARRAWLHVANRLRAISQNVCVLGAVAMLLIAASPDSAEASALFSSEFAYCLRIMSNAILARLAWRIGLLVMKPRLQAVTSSVCRMARPALAR